MNPLEPISHSELKSWLECLPNLAELEQHALTHWLHTTDFIQSFLRQHPAQTNAPVGPTVCMALRDFWRSAFMQRNFSPKLKRVWNTFFILEAAYFYPAVITSLFPGSLYEIGALLCSKEHLALLIADGDVALAQKIAAEYPAFWEAIIPADEIPSLQTLSARRDAAIEKLVKELNRQLGMTISMPSSQVTSSVIPDLEVSPQHLEHPKSIQDMVSEIPALVPCTTSNQAPKAPMEFHRDSLWLGSQEGFVSRMAYDGTSIRFYTWPHGDEISSSDLDAIAINIDVASLMTTLGIRPSPNRLERWGEDREFLLALLQHFVTHGDDDARLQCAACLRHAQLSKIVEIEINSRSKFWKVKRLSVLESIARIALDLREDEFTRSLAEAILAQQTHVEQLWNLDKLYVPLAHKLTIVLGNRLYYDENSGRLELAG